RLEWAGPDRPRQFRSHLWLDRCTLTLIFIATFLLAAGCLMSAPKCPCVTLGARAERLALGLSVRPPSVVGDVFEEVRDVLAGRFFPLCVEAIAAPLGTKSLERIHSCPRIGRAQFREDGKCLDDVAECLGVFAAVLMDPAI
ncbi:MAG: hypothetical protein ACREAC_12190, partial [Blastocatellia bacterium]